MTIYNLYNYYNSSLEVAAAVVVAAGISMNLSLFKPG
jgi:hypothetical protein